MSKRRATSSFKDDLTGGTHDFNPQFFSIYGVPAAAGTTETFTFPLPVLRVGGGQGVNRAQVFEILKIFWLIPSAPSQANVAENSKLFNAVLTTHNYGATAAAFNSPSIIDTFYLESTGAFTAGGTYYRFGDRVVCHDLTDGVGHGVLIGTDNLFLQLGGTATFATLVACRILYRIKNVELSEFLGIVQSQS